MKTIRMIAFALAVVLIASCGQRRSVAQKGEKSDEKIEEEVSDNGTSSLVIDFSLPDIDGKEVAVSSEFAKHKITIIDFWSSWCGPCRREMPNLVRVYNDYKDRGLGIIGVSLDEDEASWRNAIKDMGMAWTQLSDLQGWGNRAAQMYGIESIPFTIVVDNKGQVLAAGLRGEELEAFVRSSLAEK